MGHSNHRKTSGLSGFLTRLARDIRGNTIAIMAIAVFPLAGMVGGGIDISRMYIVKTRLQHACDAGALAGRKVMGGGAWSANSNAADTEAKRFFDANFDTTGYGIQAETDMTIRRSFAESAGKVTGTAHATVPMTLMRIFGKTQETMTVTCEADMRLPNTDIMFVLDTTKSMDCAPSDTAVFCNTGVATDQKRITGLRIAVKCFYQIIAKLDVDDVDCNGAEPSGGTGNGAQVRFGFVPYATNVNVGRLLPHDYMVDSWWYQTRKPNLAVPPQKTDRYWQVYGSSLTQADCLSYMNNTAFTGFTPTSLTSGGPSPTPTVATTFTSDGAATSGTSLGEWGWSSGSDPTWGTWSTASDTSTGGSDNKKSCRRKRTDITTYYQEKFQNWTYGQLSVDVSGLKGSGSSWNNSFTMPASTVDDNTNSVADATVGGDVPQAVIDWDGCIEERETVETTDFDPIPSGAKDLDIDLVPNSDATRWKPALPRLIFTRASTSGSNYNASSWSGSSTSGWNTGSTTTSSDYNNGSSYACPTPAAKLQAWNASDFKSFVNGLTPEGATYHDIGMLWGARLMSPQGIFASENAFTPQGGEIDRHMIFMTDGDTNGNFYDYAAYGLPWFDQRQTASTPTKQDMDDQINARFLALCEAVKNKNITLWVISFGASVDTTTQSRLSACASNGRFFTASDSAALQTTFANIANQISQLRLTN